MSNALEHELLGWWNNLSVRETYIMIRPFHDTWLLCIIGVIKTSSWHWMLKFVTSDATYSHPQVYDFRTCKLKTQNKPPWSIIYLMNFNMSWVHYSIVYFINFNITFINYQYCIWGAMKYKIKHLHITFSFNVAFPVKKDIKMLTYVGR